MRGKKGATPENMERYETFAREYLRGNKDYSGDFLKYIKHLFGALESGHKYCH